MIATSVRELGPRPQVPGYAVESALGAGGDAVVYAGRKTADGAEVALKIAVPDTVGAAARLRREAAITAEVGPPLAPGVIELVEAGTGASVLVLERLVGPSLAVIAADARGALPLAEIARLGPALVDAVAALHARGFAHLDLKPENVFFDAGRADARARLIDFGIACRLPGRREGTGDQTWRGHGEGARTDEVALWGTAEYMSPEQCEGRRADARSDVYALGVILYELVTGRVPFFGAASEIRRAHVARRPQRPAALAEVPAPLDEAIARCLAKDPAERFADARALQAAIRAVMSDFRTYESRTWASGPGALYGSRTGGDEPGGERGTGAGAARERGERGDPDAAITARITRRTVACGAVWLRSEQPALLVREVARSFGGELAHAAGALRVAVFDPAASENPVRRAVEAARALIERGVTTTALVDLVDVRVREHAGERRYLSARFRGEGLYPGAADPPGVVLTLAAREVLPGLLVEVLAGRDDHERARFRCLEDAGELDHSVSALEVSELIGRDDAIRSLLESARRATIERRPTVATITAEAGVGKSHLARALAAELSSAFSDARVVHVHAPETGSAVRDRTARDLARRLLDLPGGLGADDGRAALRDRLGRKRDREHGPALALLMDWTPPDSPELAMLTAAPGALRAALVRALGELAQQIARRSPLLVVVDDAHLSDALALDALELATLAEHELPIWVCALARPGFERARPAWGARAGSSEVIELRPLDARDAQQLCRHLLLPVEDVPVEALEDIAARTGGMPLLMVELVRGLKREGKIRQQAKGGWYLATDELDHPAELPLIRWLVTRELAALPDDLLAHARLLARLGSSFGEDEVAGVVRELEASGRADAFPLDSSVALERLRAQGVVADNPAGGLALRHSLLRDILAEQLALSDRVAIHRAAYRYHTQRVGDGEADPDRVARLAYHAENCGMTGRAAALYLDLADRARRRHAYVEAERLYSQALASIPERERERRIEALRGRGVMRYRAGRYADSIADLTAARAEAARLGRREDQIEILLDEAMALDWMHEYRGAKARVDEASAMFAALPPGTRADLDAAVLLGRGRSAWRFSQWDDACTLLGQCLQVCERLGRAAYELRVVALNILGYIHAAAGRADAGREVLDRALALAESHSDPMHIAATCGNRRLLGMLAGDREGVRRELERSRQIGREMGMVILEYMGEYNLGEFLYQSGDLQRAWPHVHRAVAIERTRLAGTVPPAAELLRARLHAYAGETAELRAALADVAARQDRSRRDGSSESEFFPSEQVLYDACVLCAEPGEPGALGGDAAWDELERRAADSAVEHEHIEVIELRGLAALRAGDRAAGERALARALAACEDTPSVLAPRIRARLQPPD